MPEFFGRPSHYTEGTDFLGTPKDHLDVSARAHASFLLLRSASASVWCVVYSEGV